MQVTLEVTCSRVRAFWQQSNRSGQSDTRPSLARTTIACSCFPRDAHSFVHDLRRARVGTLQAAGFRAALPGFTTHPPPLASRLCHAKAKPKLRSQCLRLTLQAQHESLPLLPGQTDETAVSKVTYRDGEREVRRRAELGSSRLSVPPFQGGLRT